MRFLSISISTSSFSSNSDSVLSFSDYSDRKSQNGSVISKLEETYLELVVDFSQFISENVSLTSTCINLFLENLGSFLEDLYLLGLSFVTDIVPFVIEYNTLAADINLVIFAEEFGPFVWMLQTVLLSWLLFLLLLALLLLLCNVLLAVEIV